MNLTSHAWWSGLTSFLLFFTGNPRNTYAHCLYLGWQMAIGVFVGHSNLRRCRFNSMAHYCVLGSAMTPKEKLSENRRFHRLRED
ncbi:hypothetical protein F5Y00DRAFT_248812 [Daldinia vernicosa]|uniref:uncharacterized protein n=1 Tax=Daldinia vernicosa TaxID=114800 RepID=UPI002008E205|nr:uncharacterized protein F5Y00DRAFT_248812 [Daldinia vernicosa]KAI0844366.1 hypothetical protein F5Y00DRAFT_248812 [Daldinia vernicosa]